MSKVISVRVSDETAALFEQRVQAAGVSKADYFTSLFVDGAVQVEAIEPDPETILHARNC